MFRATPLIENSRLATLENTDWPSGLEALEGLVSVQLRALCADFCAFCIFCFVG